MTTIGPTFRRSTCPATARSLFLKSTGSPPPGGLKILADKGTSLGALHDLAPQLHPGFSRFFPIPRKRNPGVWSILTFAVKTACSERFYRPGQAETTARCRLDLRSRSKTASAVTCMRKEGPGSLNFYPSRGLAPCPVGPAYLGLPVSSGSGLTSQTVNRFPDSSASNRACPFRTHGDRKCCS